MIIEITLPADPGLDPGMIVTVRPADDQAGRYRHSSQHSNRQSSDVQADPHMKIPAARYIGQPVPLWDQGRPDVIVHDMIADVPSDQLEALVEGSHVLTQRPGLFR